MTHTYRLGRLGTRFERSDYGLRAVISDDGEIVSHVRSEAGPSSVGVMSEDDLLRRFPQLREELPLRDQK